MERLPPETLPPPELEDRVVTELRRQGLLVGDAGTPPTEPPPLPRRRWWPALAALLAGVLLGWGLATRPPALAPVVGGEPLFLLTFSGGPQHGDALLHNIHTNAEWALGPLAERFVSGQKLLPDGVVVVAGKPPAPTPLPRPDDFTPTGFFLIHARDLDEATAVARSSPHLSLGGHLTVRPVDDLSWIGRSLDGS